MTSLILCKRKIKNSNKSKEEKEMASKLNCHRQILSSAWLFVLVVITGFALLTKAQFFTKSSKSIPRMGRRSNESPVPIDQYKRQLIDNLVDEYGPSLLEKLQSKGLENEEEVGKNEQSLDWLQGAQFYDVDPALADDYGAVGMRQERSTSTRSTEVNREPSLAIRALNTDRLLQYLSNGGHPTMIFGRSLNNPATKLGMSPKIKQQQRKFASD